MYLLFLVLFIPSWDEFSSDTISLQNDTFSLASLMNLLVNYLSFLLSENRFCFHFVKDIFTGYWILVDSFIFLWALKRCHSIVHWIPLFPMISAIILTVFLLNIIFLISRAAMFFFFLWFQQFDFEKFSWGSLCVYIYIFFFWAPLNRWAAVLIICRKILANVSSDIFLFHSLFRLFVGLHLHKW